MVRVLAPRLFGRVLRASVVVVISTISIATLYYFYDPGPVPSGPGAIESWTEEHELNYLDAPYHATLLNTVEELWDGRFGYVFQRDGANVAIVEVNTSSVLQQRLPVIGQVFAEAAVIGGAAALLLVRAKRCRWRALARQADTIAILTASLAVFFVFNPASLWIWVLDTDAQPGFSWRWLGDNPLRSLQHSLIPAALLGFALTPALFRSLDRDFDNEPRRILHPMLQALRHQLPWFMSLSVVVLARFGYPSLTSPVVGGVARGYIVLARNATIWIAIIIIAAGVMLDTAVDFLDYRFASRSGRAVATDERHF